MIATAVAPNGRRTVPELAALVAKINSEHRAAEAKVTEALRHARRAGEALNAAKALVPYGQWGKWLTEHFDSEPAPVTCRLYMRIAREWPRIEEEMNANGVSNLSLRRAASIVYDRDAPKEDEDGAIVDEEHALDLVGLPPDALEGLSPRARAVFVHELLTAYRELCVESKPAGWEGEPGEVFTNACGLRYLARGVLTELHSGKIGHASIRDRIRVDELVRSTVPVSRWPGARSSRRLPPEGASEESYFVRVSFIPAPRQGMDGYEERAA